jgi:hypothetical protein
MFAFYATDVLDRVIGLVDFVHHPADVSQASATFRVFCETVTPIGFLFGGDLFQNQGTAILDEILFDIPPGMTETVTNKIGGLFFLGNPVIGTTPSDRYLFCRHG